jgi:DUF971 family protein
VSAGEPRSWPSEIRLNKAKDRLFVTFDSGERIELSAEYLRTQSPSAEVKGHGQEKMPPVPGKRGVRIATLTPIGNYAVRIAFDDSHDTGLFTWDYLHDLARTHGVRWPAYLEDLGAHGMQRD